MTVRRGGIVAAVVYGLLVVAIVVLADTGHLEPVLTFAHRVPFFDKIGHLVLGGLLSFLVNVALDARTFSVLGARFLVGSTVVSVVAALEEVSQQWLPSRSYDLGDLAADLIGIAVGGALADFVRRRRCLREEDLNDET